MRVWKWTRDGRRGDEGGRDLPVVASEPASMRMGRRSEVCNGSRLCLMRLPDCVAKFLAQELSFERLKDVRSVDFDDGTSVYAHFR